MRLPPNGSGRDGGRVRFVSVRRGCGRSASSSASTLLGGTACSARSPCTATRRGRNGGAANWSRTTASTGSDHLTSQD
jgi:hypothetical protein